MKKADLHLHTYYSDGTFSPEELVKEAAKRGLSAIAVCDHDCTDGIAETAAASRIHDIEVIPGVEITSEKDKTEIHMLGYFIDKDTDALAGLLEDLQKSRVRRIYDMIERLKAFKLGIPPEAVFSLSPKGTVGRLHLAKALYNAGLVPSVKEAFSKYLGDHAPCYIRRFNVSPEEAIGAIIKAGGVAVYAHPKVMGRDDFIPDFIKAGLGGIEVYHTDHNDAVSRYYLNTARKYGLIATGGSDCHGTGKGRILMGGVTVPYSVVEELRERAKEIRKE